MIDMKVSAMILAFYLTVLMVYPAGEILAHLSTAKATHSCCKKDASAIPVSEKTNKSSTNSCCDKGVCNPFMSCCCCAFYYHTPDYRLVANVLPAGMVFPIVNHYFSSFTASCFHPPEKNIVFS